MRNLLKTLCLPLLFLCILTACHDPEEIKSIRVVYMPEYINTMTAVENVLEMFDYPHYETVLRSRKFLQSFDLETSKLTPLDSLQLVDFRIWCHVYRRNGEEHDLILGSHFGTIYDGVGMYDNPELLRLIKDVIYKEERIREGTNQE